MEIAALEITGIEIALRLVNPAAFPSLY